MSWCSILAEVNYYAKYMLLTVTLMVVRWLCLIIWIIRCNIGIIMQTSEIQDPTTIQDETQGIDVDHLLRLRGSKIVKFTHISSFFSLDSGLIDPSLKVSTWDFNSQVSVPILTSDIGNIGFTWAVQHCQHSCFECLKPRWPQIAAPRKLDSKGCLKGLIKAKACLITIHWALIGLERPFKVTLNSGIQGQ